MITVDEDILFYAFRYALGRRTYAVSSVAQSVIKNWNTLSENTKKTIQKEIKEAISEGHAGDVIVDVPEWTKVLQLEV